MIFSSTISVLTISKSLHSFIIPLISFSVNTSFPSIPLTSLIEIISSETI